MSGWVDAVLTAFWHLVFGLGSERRLRESGFGGHFPDRYAGVNSGLQRRSGNLHFTFLIFLLNVRRLVDLFWRNRWTSRCIKLTNQGSAPGVLNRVVTSIRDCVSCTYLFVCFYFFFCFYFHIYECIYRHAEVAATRSYFAISSQKPLNIAKVSCPETSSYKHRTTHSKIKTL